jgi:hypothetical protein
LLDVDQTGGVDANGDGIDDAFAPIDTDGDGIPDHLDIDSDNDGIPDTLEAGLTGKDTDGDGIDDAFDVDATGGTDLNGDGIDDALGFLDSDGDGIPDFRDLDSDNDGIYDSIEAGVLDENQDGFADNGTQVTQLRDTDGDGIPDYLDLDSNGDGVLDIIGTDYSDLDLNKDGRIDDITDVDNDGVPDVIDSNIGHFGGSLLDSDGDGIPDSRDLDDDNDGIPDWIENGFSAPDQTGLDRDSDGDGIPDRLDLDSDSDGIPDVVEAGHGALLTLAGDTRLTQIPDANDDGLHDSISLYQVPLDSDGDGIPDYLDGDSDNDGFPDELESGDYNHDGIDDSKQNTGSVNTGLKGGGAMNLWWLSLLGVAAFAKRRRVARHSALAVLAASSLGVTNAQAAESDCGAEGYRWKECWYVGGTVGLSHLVPEGRANGWGVSDKSSQTSALHIGQYITPTLFWELSYMDAGEAGLSNINPSTPSKGSSLR